MITSASGWRKVFVVSGDEEDNFPDIGTDNIIISALAADTFADYIIEKTGSKATVVVGTDARPTGGMIADITIRVLMSRKITVLYTGIIAAPEIMAFARSADAFIYISASHNPIGHNGIKFGLSDGGVVNADENAKLVKIFNEKMQHEDPLLYAAELSSVCDEDQVEWVYAEMEAVKSQAKTSYRTFTKSVILGMEDKAAQDEMFTLIRKSVRLQPLGVVADMNGSARTLSLDSELLQSSGLSYFAINNEPGQIVHTIIPEPENLVWCAREMARLHDEGHEEVKLGYMPDCDGDRGNIVYWNEKMKTAEVLKAQEVFALSVLSELAYSIFQFQMKNKTGLFARTERYLRDTKSDIRFPLANLPADFRLGVAVNCPTSMRIEEIAQAFNAKVFRAEVGEANVVNLAREKREQGYTIRILGEGSNGGNITHPAAVRDPINTLYALIKLLLLKDTVSPTGKPVLGLFHLWCRLSCQEEKYKEDFTLSDIIETLPAYTTTGVSESRALLHIKETDQIALKKRFQRIFEGGWQTKADLFKRKFGFFSYEAIGTVGTKEMRHLDDYGKSQTGGLKIVFYGENKEPLAFMWMRGSKTEPVFRIMCDVKGNNPEMENGLIGWETEMLAQADSQ